VQVTVAPGASEAAPAGQVGPTRLPWVAGAVIVSATAMPLTVTLPLLRTAKE
jgi:hypothetical protein